MELEITSISGQSLHGNAYSKGNIIIISMELNSKLASAWHNPYEASNRGSC